MTCRVEWEAGEEPLVCVSCGHVLDGDPDEDPNGNAGEPQCGECARSANFVVMDYADGELDDEIDR